MPNLTYFSTSLGFANPEKGLFFNLNFYGDLSQQDLWLTMSFTMGNVIVRQLSLSILWTMRQLHNFDAGNFLDPNKNIIAVNLKYHMLPNMYWGLLVKINGEVNNFADQNFVNTITTVPFIFLGVDFSFRY